jgi:hypothetical protein
MKKAEEIEKWLNAVPIRTELTGAELNDLFELTANRAFKALLGLLLGERQSKLVQLANLAINSPETGARASVLQGEIKGIDKIRETLIEVYMTQPQEQK